jgi:hypothetical protein
MIGGYHLFALVPAEAVLPNPMPAGLEAGDIGLLPAGGILAAAQPVSGEFLTRLRENNDGPAAQAWLTERLLEHERVVEAFFAGSPVFPLGFGVLLANPEALRASIIPHLDTLLAFFACTAGRQEWCLKFYLREQAAQRGEMARIARNGLDYLAARRAVPERLAAREATASDFVEKALASLDPYCETVLGREAGAAPEKGLRLVANLALLVRATERAELLAAVRALVEPAAAGALELTLTGPWPLYSFRPRIVLGAPALAVTG